MAMTLEKIPNTGKVNAEKLRKAKIHTPEDLRKTTGSKDAFIAVRLKADSGACFNILCGLECAVQGIR